MPVSDVVRLKLDQIEQELTTALSELPSSIARDRIKFARALVLFTKTRLELDEGKDSAKVDPENTLPVRDTGQYPDLA